MRATAEETGAYVTGLEPDAAIAQRGMELSKKAGKAKHAAIAHYDPAHLVLDRAYDFVDIPNGLILRILQLHLQPALLQQRPFRVRLTRPIAEGDVERHPEGIIGKFTVDDIRQCRAQRTIQPREIIGRIDIERGQ